MLRLREKYSDRVMQRPIKLWDSKSLFLKRNHMLRLREKYSDRVIQRPIKRQDDKSLVLKLNQLTTRVADWTSDAKGSAARHSL